MHVLTTNISKTIATVNVSTTIENDRGTDAVIRLRTRLIGPNGKAARAQVSEITVPAGKQQEFTQDFSVGKPVLWSLDNPALYRAEVELVDSGEILDQSSATFGIRTISFSVTNGFELNGEMVKLKGGCMHHDNGPLGSAAIDRAEERRVQLMKAYGFNAIRTSHNPPSPAFLDACDRCGVLVLDEAFDCWEQGKNPDDYGKYFDALVAARFGFDDSARPQSSERHFVEHRQRNSRSAPPNAATSLKNNCATRSAAWTPRVR